MKFIVLQTVSDDNLENYLSTWKQRRSNDVKVILRPHLSVESINGSKIFSIVESEKLGSIFNYCKILVGQGANVQLIPLFNEREAASDLKRFYKSKKQADLINRRVHIQKLKDFGSTNKLEVLPLIDWKANNERLKVETGVSYLVKTDENTILFDMGLNSRDEDPSPLLQNMKILGVDIDSIDTIFISHKHGDHVGGGKWVEKNTFSVTGNQPSLRISKVYTPVKMTYPGLNLIHTFNPLVINRGIASTGIIARAMYSRGVVEEQSLAINVAGKGIVLIVGCGHQTIPKLVDRVHALFKEPIYGIIGGLHYPVMGGPWEEYGFAAHKYSGTGKTPWNPISVSELSANIDLLRNIGIKLIALSPHDSSNLSVEAFDDAFPDAYIDIKVGKRIVVQ